VSEGILSLKDNLEQQVAVFEQFYAMEIEKKDALVQNSIRDIETITTRQEKLLKTAGRLENERLSWVKQIARDLERTPEDLTLTELSGCFPVLNEIRPDLERIVRQLQEIQEINAQLLTQAMRLVNYTFDLLTHEQSQTYGPRDVKTNRFYEESKKKQLMNWRI